MPPIWQCVEISLSVIALVGVLLTSSGQRLGMLLINIPQHTAVMLMLVVAVLCNSVLESLASSKNGLKKVTFFKRFYLA